jgi:hypothetical protein
MPGSLGVCWLQGGEHLLGRGEEGKKEKGPS